MTVATQIESFATFAIALVVVVQIARVGAVPAPWKLLPAVILGVLTVIWLLLNLINYSVPSGSYFPNPILYLLTAIDGLTRIVGTMLLGVIAIVLGDRANRSTHATGGNSVTSAATDNATTASVLN
jgi:hypothetical protein